MSGQAWLVYVKDINRNIPTTWRGACGDRKKTQRYITKNNTYLYIRFNSSKAIIFYHLTVHTCHISSKLNMITLLTYIQTSSKPWFGFPKPSIDDCMPPTLLAGLARRQSNLLQTGRLLRLHRMHCCNSVCCKRQTRPISLKCRSTSLYL